jgi:thiamine pyrophosphate-dependent acetolactate synthase large subunit-like protein
MASHRSGIEFGRAAVRMLRSARRFIVLNGQGAKRRRPQAAVADLLPLATRIALRGGTF